MPLLNVDSSKEEGSSVTPERRQMLEQLARRVVEHEPARRGEIIDLVCGTDAALRRDLLPVVAAVEAGNGNAEAAPTMLPAEPSPGVSRFGSFELGSKIGKGGMG